MSDVEVALELLKIALKDSATAIENGEPDKLLALYRKCLAAVRAKPE